MEFQRLHHCDCNPRGGFTRLTAAASDGDCIRSWRRRREAEGGERAETRLPLPFYVEDARARRRAGCQIHAHHNWPIFQTIPWKNPSPKHSILLNHANPYLAIIVNNHKINLGSQWIHDYESPKPFLKFLS